jgi:hypothetical protein
LQSESPMPLHPARSFLPIMQILPAILTIAAFPPAQPVPPLYRGE